jgi:hypothetical protein
MEAHPERQDDTLETSEEIRVESAHMQLLLMDMQKTRLMQLARDVGIDAWGTTKQIIERVRAWRRTQIEAEQGAPTASRQGGAVSGALSKKGAKQLAKGKARKGWAKKRCIADSDNKEEPSEESSDSESHSSSSDDEVSGRRQCRR